MNSKMKAIVYKEYGSPDVLKIQDVEKPAPKENEVLVRVRATSVNYGDLIARNFRNISAKEFNMPLLFWIFARMGFGFCKPRKQVLGNAFSGVVQSVGSNVNLFKEGDAIFGYTGEKMGAYAQYLTLPEDGIIAEKPRNITYEEASAIPYGAIMAYNLLKKAPIKKGQKVLVIGASGGIGAAAVQLAKQYYGADVTGICSKKRVEFVKNSGADNVVDYEEEDFTKSSVSYNLIFDVLGKGTFSSCKKILKPTGIYLLASFKAKKLFQMIWTALTGRKKIICAIATPKQEDLVFIKSLIEDGIMKPIIDKKFSLEQTAEAHKYIESGEKKGNVIIEINP